MQIGGGPYSVVSESPVCSRSTSRGLAEAVEHTFALDESYCSAGIFVRSQVQHVTPDMASSVNSSNDSHHNPPRCLPFCNRRPPHVRSTVSFALGIDGRGLSKEFLWRADNKGWGLATSARHLRSVGMTFLPGWPAENCDAVLHRMTDVRVAQRVFRRLLRRRQ